MRRLVHTELLKQRTTRTFVFGIALAPVAGALVTFANYELPETRQLAPRSAQLRPSPRRVPSASVITLIALLLGVLDGRAATGTTR